jgi:hypothetical protein
VSLPLTKNRCQADVGFFQKVSGVLHAAVMFLFSCHIRVEESTEDVPKVNHPTHKLECFPYLS